MVQEGTPSVYRVGDLLRRSLLSHRAGRQAHGRGIQSPGCTYARAIIGGLIVAKLLFFVDLIPGVDAFRGKPLIYNMLWKTPIYLAMSLVYRYLEPVIGSVVARVSVAEAHAPAVEEFTHPAFWAIEVWLAALFAVFVMMRELTLALGKDKVRILFFGR